MTVFSMILSSLLTDLKNRKLAYSAWLPFDYAQTNLYFVAYAHQIVALIGTSLLNVACDAIICGFCVHAVQPAGDLGAQIERDRDETETGSWRFCAIPRLLVRVSFLSPDSDLTIIYRECMRVVKREAHFFSSRCSVSKHRYALAIQQKFQLIIGIQLVSSTLVVCFILYELANTPPMSTKYLQFVLYMLCMMTQIYFYCWYGNQLKLKVLVESGREWFLRPLHLDRSTNGTE